MKGSLTDALLAIHEVLAKAEIPHALCGGVAANLYRAEVRATSDVDLAIAVAPAQTIELLNTFEKLGWKAEPFWRKAEQLRLSRRDLPRVDCIIANTEYERSAIDRAVTATIEGRVIPVLAVEDLIVFKLVAGRARDYEAVAAIINTQGDRLDSEYVKAWLDQFGASEAWDRAVLEAERESDA